MSFKGQIRLGSIQKIIAMNSSGLTVPFAIFCIVDLFGIFPIIVLPGSIVKCGKKRKIIQRAYSYARTLYPILSNYQGVHRMVGNTVGYRRVCGSSVHGRSIGKVLDYSRRNRTGYHEENPVKNGRARCLGKESA